MKTATTRSGRFLNNIKFLPIYLITSCAIQDRPLLTRGLPKSEREFYIMQNGYYMPWNKRQAFINGDIQLGMNKEMVFQMIGTPDRTFNKDCVWEYTDRKGSTILHLIFDNKNDTLMSLIGHVN